MTTRAQILGALGCTLLAVGACGTAVQASSGATGTTTSSSSSTSGAGGDAMCAHTKDVVSIDLTLPDGTPAGCSTNGLSDLIGVVQPSADTSTLTIDTCAPNANCAPALATLVVHATNLAFSAPAGSFARVRVGSAPGGFAVTDCLKSVVVNEVDTFGGMTDPNAKHRVWLVAVSGTLVMGDPTQQAAAMAELPFAQTSALLSQCSALPVGCEPIGQKGPFSLHFTDKIDPKSERVVTMGVLAKGFQSGGQTFDIYDGKSANYGGCDENNTYEWWLAPSAL